MCTHVLGIFAAYVHVYMHDWVSKHGSSVIFPLEFSVLLWMCAISCIYIHTCTYIYTCLVVYSESDDLCKEGAGEPGGHQQTVTQGTLVETLAHHVTGKLVVTKCDVGWVSMVGVHLERERERGREGERERGRERYSYIL